MTSSLGLISLIEDLGSKILGYGLPFLFVLSLVVFVHEFGHFIVARWCGVKVEAFSIGFGRALVSWRDKLGTVWKVGWLPLGGYVKFVGDEGPASNPDREAMERLVESGDAADPEAVKGYFHFKPLHQRAAVVAAGPVANFIFAIFVFAAMYSIVGEQHVPARVDAVQPGSAAAAAGFKSGDVVEEINGRRIKSFGQLQEIVSVSAGDPLDVVVQRDGRRVVLEAVPESQNVTDRFGNSYKMGQLGLTSRVEPGDVTYVRYDPFTAVWKGVDRTFFVIDKTLDFVGDMILGRQDASQLSGPLGIATISGQVAQIGIVALINLAAMLSISIGLINLFPIPLLDGGHLMYYAYEAARGRPLGARAQELGFRIGLAFVISMMVFATWNDLVKLQFFGG